MLMIQIANAANTGASTGADLNGGAVKDACKKLRQNLEACLQTEAPENYPALKYWKKHGKWYIPDDMNHWKDVSM